MPMLTPAEKNGMTPDQLITRALEAIRDCYWIDEAAIAPEHALEIRQAGNELARVIKDRLQGRIEQSTHTEIEWSDNDIVGLTPRGRATDV